MSTRVAEEARRRRYGRDTPDFARVANLSDGVFAIAMTLLVLGLDRRTGPGRRSPAPVPPGRPVPSARAVA